MLFFKVHHLSLPARIMDWYYSPTLVVPNFLSTLICFDYTALSEVFFPRPHPSSIYIRRRVLFNPFTRWYRSIPLFSI